MVYKRPESVLVVIYSDQHNVLLLQRQDDPDFWQSVTGTMEEGEQPIQTAIREVQEEIGVDVHAINAKIVDCGRTNQYEIRPQWRHRYPPGETTNTEHVFRLQIPETSRLQLTEHLAFKWLGKHAAIEQAWSPSNQEGIAHFVPELVT